MMAIKPSRYSQLIAAGLFSFALIGVSDSQAAALTWGANGAGGSGNWDTSTANWWNGTQNLPWTNGGDAVFAGAGGTVDVPNGSGVSVSSLVFNVPGYILNGNYLQSSVSDLAITANADAKIAGGIPAAFTKYGSGTLTIDRVSHQTYTVAEGRLRVLLADAGTAVIKGGTIETSGNGSTGNLRVGGSGTLDIGGDAAAQFTVSDSFYLDNPSAKLTLRFGLGSTAQDRLSLGFLATMPSSGAYYFDFEDLGGLTAGVTYTLISQGQMTPSSFHLSPELVDAGWVASFSSVSEMRGTIPQGLKVTFSAIPEPETWGLLALGSGALISATAIRRRRQTGR